MGRIRKCLRLIIYAGPSPGLHQRPVRLGDLCPALRQCAESQSAFPRADAGWGLCLWRGRGCAGLCAAAAHSVDGRDQGDAAERRWRWSEYSVPANPKRSFIIPILTGGTGQEALYIDGGITIQHTIGLSRGTGVFCDPSKGLRHLGLKGPNRGRAARA